MDSLPKPIINYIMSFLKIIDRGRFSRTCKKFLIYMPGIKDLLALRNQERAISLIIEDLDICRICYADMYLYKCSGCRRRCCDMCLMAKGCTFCSNEKKCEYCPGRAYYTCYYCYSSVCSSHVFSKNAMIGMCLGCKI